MKDPLNILSDRYPYNPDKILASACGDAYVAIMLTSGHIGVCSTLGKPVETDPLQMTRPSLNKPDHRILMTAFANAHANYQKADYANGDIFEQVDFSRRTHIVLVGYFPPLVEKFQNENIPVSVFDLEKDYSGLTDLSLKDEKLVEADCVIITATTLINSTLSGILAKINGECETYLLGPSTPLFPELMSEFNLTGMFGMIFKPYDFGLLEMITSGMGTRSFSKKGKKVSL